MIPAEPVGLKQTPILSNTGRPLVNKVFQIPIESGLHTLNLVLP